MASQTRPEPMNASPHHPKVKVALALGSPLYVAGGYIAGKMEMECRADKGLGIGVMMVELFAIQELTSRDHSATSTFLHSRRLFQGPGLPPSNAVQSHPAPGDPPLPPHYHQARRGISTFLFRFPIPSSSPSSINLGSGLARVKYEVKASVGVAWKSEKRLVTDKKEVDVVEAYEEDFSRAEPEGVVVGENGKIWVQGRVVGGVIVAGESACVELQVKNHSQKKNTGLFITLTRALYLPDIPASTKSPLQISDTLTTVAFRSPEYIIPPGAEGVASLVFDVPKHARGVKGGTREDDEAHPRITEALFEVRCVIGIKMTMGLGSKDIHLDIPVTVVHPSALPELPAPDPHTVYPYSTSPGLIGIPGPPGPPVSPGPYMTPIYPIHPMSPPLHPYIEQGQVWLPQPTHTPHPQQLFLSPIPGQQYYFPPPLVPPVHTFPPRPSSVGPSAPQHFDPGLQLSEEGKGERASRIAQHLRLSSRHRSVSPQSHRFPYPPSNPIPIPSTKPQLHNLPPVSPVDNNKLSVSPSGSQGVVYSPRPLLSPKHSYTIDPFTQHALPKSDRVEELERMAAEVDARTKDLSADIPKDDLNKQELLDVHKTLPSPPVPTGKDQIRVAPAIATRARVDTYFAAPEPQSPSDQTPPTPTLTAVTPAKKTSRNNLLSVPGPAESGLSGLDALERRLLVEVGTRKLDVDVRKPDVRTILPITIPPPNTVPEPLNDSAISSLTLADHDRDHDSDERTHKAGKSSVSGDDRDHQDRRREPGSSKGAGRSKRDGERKHGKKKERHKEGDVHKKKEAKGRVAAWLGAIEPDAPPPDSIPPINSSAITIEPFITKTPPTSEKMHMEAGAKEVSAAPNPRSSGFVPIGTHQRSTFRARHLVLDAQPSDPVEEARQVTDLWSSVPEFKSAPVELRPSPVGIPQPLQTDRNISAPSSHAAVDKTKGRTPRSTPKPSNPNAIVPKKLAPRLPVFPPPRLDPEVKYDIRSARGGRGGKVTAVASIWASGAASDSSSKDSGQKADIPPPKPLKAIPESPKPLPHDDPPPAPEPKRVDFAGKRRPIIKSTSVPAIISSSHATPTLSTTASLARPANQPNKGKSPVQIPPTISETPSEIGRTLSTTKASVKPSSPADLAFGQARLRDLIKKYQAQPT